jgi:hypothetical protein
MQKKELHPEMGHDATEPTMSFSVNLALLSLSNRRIVFSAVTAHASTSPRDIAALSPRRGAPLG